MQRLFDTRPLGLGDGLLIVATGAALMILLEMEKQILRKTGRLTQ
jgi:hypothetical protein